MCALAFLANASLASMAADNKPSEEWLKFHYYPFTDQAGLPPYYNLSLSPTDVMTVWYFTRDGFEESFERPVKAGSFAKLSTIIERKWPMGTVVEFQCSNDWSHYLEYRLIFSSTGRHVSTAWYDRCMRDGQHEELHEFSISLFELLDKENIEKELLKRTTDANRD